jgi:hypothetical protein
VDAEASFLVDLLGFHRLEFQTPTSNWFAGEDGKEIHLSEDPDHQPAARAHVAIDLGDELAETVRRFDQSGHEYTSSDRPDFRVLFCRDPAGNRWEIRGSIAK